MNKAENFSKLKNELSQFIGGLLVNVGDSSIAGHQVEAALCETLIEVSKKNDEIDMFAAKPILRAAAYIINEHVRKLGSQNSELMTLSDNDAQLQEDLKMYKTISVVLDELVNKIRKE